MVTLFLDRNGFRKARFIFMTQNRAVKLARFAHNAGHSNNRPRMRRANTLAGNDVLKTRAISTLRRDRQKGE